VGFATVGSIANLLVASGALWLSQRGTDPRHAAYLQLVGFVHGAWGAAQLLPLVPFRVGTEMSVRLPPPLRFAHALASTVLAINVTASAALVLKSPLLFAAAGLAA